MSMQLLMASPWEKVVSQLSDLLALVVAGLVSWLCYAIIVYVAKIREKANVETSKIKDDNTRNFIQSATGRIFDTFTLAVYEMEKVMVPILKSTSSDGKLTVEDQEAVARAATEYALKILGNDAPELLSAVTGDTEKYLSALITKLVADMKTTPTPLPSIEQIIGQTSLND